MVSIGNGRLLDDGTRSTLQVSAGDRVLFSSYAGETFKLGEDELFADARRRHPRHNRISAAFERAYLFLKQSQTETTIIQKRKDPLMAKMIAFDQEARDAMRRGVTKLAKAVKVTLGPARTKRHHPKELRLANGNQGRRQRRQGSRFGRHLREYGRADGPRSRLENQRRSRRWNDYGNYHGRSHLQRRASRGCGRR